MPRTQDGLVMKWIISFAILAIVLVVFGGYVRLTRAGLSIVEWNPVSGTVPPLTERAWIDEFSKYQATPEYHQINRGMTLEEYKQIFLIEWGHRLLARLAGLIFAVPFVFFLVTRRIPLGESGLYVIMGLLFLSQALMGWIMVSSGLVERPSVSHYLLAAHLFLALSLIGLSGWTILGHRFGFDAGLAKAPWSTGSIAALVGGVVLLLQMAYGAFTAGLKAGHVSSTWPQMLGRWIPAGMLSQLEPPLSNLVAAPLTVAFIHRWLAIVTLGVAIAACRIIRSAQPDAQVAQAVRVIVVLGSLQILLGIAVILSGVNIVLASLHQFNAICLFVTTVYLLNRLRSRDRSPITAKA